MVLLQWRPELHLLSSMATNSNSPNGSLHVMPLLVINLGAEMVFVLNQRLEAQNITQGKGKRVLVDVVKAMFGEGFIEEIFEPQPMYSFNSTRQIFDKLAHASVMRLNKQSMDKLYDLMIMTFKYQMLSCIAPDMLYAVTIRHLHSVKDIVSNSGVCSSLVESCLAKFQRCFKTMRLSQWTIIRNRLANFFQGSRTRISILLSSEIQSEGGTIALPITGPLPRNTEPPGMLRMFSAGSVILEAPIKHRPPPRVDIDNVFLASVSHAPIAKAFMNSDDGHSSQHSLFQGYADDSPIALGLSLYNDPLQTQKLLKKSSSLKNVQIQSSNNRGGGGGRSNSEDSSPSSPGASSSASRITIPRQDDKESDDDQSSCSRSPVSERAYLDRASASSSTSSLKETALLSNLLGLVDVSQKEFTLNLFESSDEEDDDDAAQEIVGRHMVSSEVDGRDGRKESYSKMVADLGFDDLTPLHSLHRGAQAEAKAGNDEMKDFLADEEDDLLALMDSVAK